MPLQNKFGLYGLDKNTQSPHRGSSSVMSQPRNIFVTPTRSTFRRYSLADTCLTPSPTRQQKKVNQNYHLSTKIDSNSPGFSQRVVQYSEEQEKFAPTYSRYDKLGVFPIVHFFKKDLPFLKRKATDSNISPVSFPDLSKLNTPEQNRMLLEKIIKTSPQNQSVLSHKSEPNTKSVLDALKEISRKRINANTEDFILKDDGKRMLGDYENENLTRKRMKQNNSGDDLVLTSTSRYSSIDELMASHSSMDGYFPKRTKKEKITPEPAPIKQKPVTTPTKYVSVETQTVPASPPTPPPVTTEVEKSPKQEIAITTAQQITKPKRPSPVKVFDETPLEAMRRNRLTALMGTSSPIKSQNRNDSHSSGDKLLHKPLVSILSGGSKTPQKSNKHVTFDIPDTTSQNVASSASVYISSDVTSPAVTRTSSSINSPIVSASVVESQPLQKSTESDKEAPITESIKNDTLTARQVQAVTSTLQLNNSLTSPPLNFTGAVTIPQTISSTPSTAASATKSNEGTTKSVNATGTNGGELSKFMFNSTFTKSSTPTTSTNSNQQQAGFKFDLKETPASSVSSTTFSFGTATTSTKATTTTSSPLMFGPVTASSHVAKPSLSFGASTVSKPTTPSTFPEINNTKPFGLTSATFSLNKSQKGNLAAAAAATTTTATTSGFSEVGVSISGANSFGPSAITPQTTSSIISGFGSNISTLSFAANSSSSSKPIFSFGTNINSTSTVAPSFGTSTLTQGNVAKPFSLRTGTTNSLTFPTTKASSASASFSSQANTSSAPPSFNTPGNSFASNTTPLSDAATKTPATGGGSFFFGAQNSTFKTSGFNDNNNSSAFGQNTIPTFGATTSAPTFGTTTATGAFGTTTASTFGSSAPNFGANTGSAFGAPTTTAPAFGATTTTATGFGVTATPSFGTPAPNFGSNNHTGSVASTFANVGPSSSNIFGNSGGFGSSGAGGTPSFGSNAAPNFGTSAFGSNEKSGFGTNANTENKNSFSSTFGASSFNSGFGAANTNTSFGNNANAFNTSQTNFGTAGGVFGQTANNAFGTSSPFDKSTAVPNPEPNPFGSNTSFGSSNFSAGNPATTQSGIFSFSSNSVNKLPVFSFGASEPPKPNFNFQASNSSTTNMFAPANPPPAFGSAAGSMFNIGTGGSPSTTRSSRTLQKAKRRT